MIDRVYEPEVEPNPDPPERDDNAERIRLSAEARKQLIRISFLQAFVEADRKQRERINRSRWWIDWPMVIGEISLRMWPVWVALALWIAFG